MMKSIISHYLLPALGVACLLGSCSNERVDEFFKKIIQAPPSEIERDVKGHDQIYAVHAILRMGYKGGQIGVGPNADEMVDVYNTYHVAGEETVLPIVQEIDIAKDDNGQMTVTTERDHFDVVASDKIIYGLELKYYDQNGMLINHQFTNFPYKKGKDGYSEPDEDNSTLMMHQHFFGIGNSTLPHSKKSGDKILLLAYPRTLTDVPHYIDRYTFTERGGKVEAATKFSSNNIYVPDAFELGSNASPFNNDLSWHAVELTGRPDALQPYRGSDGKKQERSLDAGAALDRLGFKGILQFRQAGISFLLQVRLCNILTKGHQRVGDIEKPAKYTNTANAEKGFLWDFNQIQPGWDSFDIDYPLPVRIIADTKDGEEKCYEAVRRFYPSVQRAELWRMLSTPDAYFYRYRRSVVRM